MKKNKTRRALLSYNEQKGQFGINSRGISLQGALLMILAEIEHEGSLNKILELLASVFLRRKLGETFNDQAVASFSLGDKIEAQETATKIIDEVLNKKDK